MGTAPNGYQTPKTNWASGDIPLASDFNRVEGNIYAVEEGSRTIDPAQTPTSNVGSLRQFLDWFANMIKRITGKTNWYDAPSKTLEDLNNHINATAPHSGHALLNHTHTRAQITDFAHKSTHEAGGNDPISNLPDGATVNGNIIYHAGNAALIPSYDVMRSYDGKIVYDSTAIASNSTVVTSPGVSSGVWTNTGKSISVNIDSVNSLQFNIEISFAFTGTWYIKIVDRTSGISSYSISVSPAESGTYYWYTLYFDVANYDFTGVRTFDIYVMVYSYGSGPTLRELNVYKNKVVKIRQ